jgi:hypothetical protein
MTAKKYKRMRNSSQRPFTYLRRKDNNTLYLAREFGVSRKKLARQIRGQPSRSTRPPTNRLLSLDQEKVFFLWLKSLDTMGAAPTAQQIEGIANYLREKDSAGQGQPRLAGKD